MHQQTNRGVGMTPTPTLDARAWLAAWADNGGIAVLAGDRLFVSRATGLDRTATESLDRLKRWIHQPGARDALAGVLGGEAMA
jgi:hypothetical protein